MNALTNLAFLFFLYSLLNSCTNPPVKYSVELTNKIDPEIVLINFGETDRSEIAKLLLSINRCQPSVIGIDAWFLNEKDRLQDSALVIALDSMQNDVLAYYIDSAGTVVKSNNKFRVLAKDEGLSASEQVNGLVSAIKPVQVVNKDKHELFALKIIQQWKPKFKTALKTDQLIPIKYTRTLDQFFHFDYLEIEDVDSEALRNKVVFGWVLRAQ